MIKELLKEPHYDDSELHLSRLAKCGKRYAFERKRDKYSEHQDIFDIGLAWEHYLTKILTEANPPGTVANNLEVKLKLGDKVFVGHIDISVATTDGTFARIFEVKYSESYNDYYDLYVRQLRAYGVALKMIGVEVELWLEIYKNKKWREYKLAPVGPEDMIMLQTQLKAYETMEYQKGIESSLCKKCPLLQFCNQESMNKYGVPIWHE